MLKKRHIAVVALGGAFGSAAFGDTIASLSVASGTEGMDDGFVAPDSTAGLNFRDRRNVPRSYHAPQACRPGMGEPFYYRASDVPDNGTTSEVPHILAKLANLQIRIGSDSDEIRSLVASLEGGDLVTAKTLFSTCISHGNFFCSKGGSLLLAVDLDNLHEAIKNNDPTIPLDGHMEVKLEQLLCGDPVTELKVYIEDSLLALRLLTGKATASPRRAVELAASAKHLASLMRTTMTLVSVFGGLDPTAFARPHTTTRF